MEGGLVCSSVSSVYVYQVHPHFITCFWMDYREHVIDGHVIDLIRVGFRFAILNI